MLFGPCHAHVATDEVDTRALLELSLEELTSLPVVTTTRAPSYTRTLPYRATVISREEIRQQLALGIDTSQILGNLIPGFSPSSQKLRTLGESLRGRNPLFMVDGIPQSDQLLDTSRDGYTIDLESVERIEVLHGANAIHGLGASGGIINLITTPVVAQQGSSSALVAGVGNSQHVTSENGHYKLSAQQAYRREDKVMLLTASWQEHGLRDDGRGNVVGLEQVQGDLMDTSSHDILLKTAWEPEQQRLKFTFHRFDMAGNGAFIAVARSDTTHQLTSTTRGDIVGKPPANEITTAAVDYTHFNVGNGALNLKMFDQRKDATFGAVVTPVFQDPALGQDFTDQSRVRSDKRGAKLSYNLAHPWALPLDTSTGIDFIKDQTGQTLLRSHRVWTPEMKFENHAPFMQFEYDLNDSLLLSAGLRREYAEFSVNDYRTLASARNTAVTGGQLSFDETLHNLGLVWTLTPTCSFVLNYAEGFGMPDVGRVLRAVNQPGLGIDDFLVIAPLVTQNRELGWHFHNDRFQWQISYFESETPFGNRLQAGADGVFTVNREQNEVGGWDMTATWNYSPHTRLDLIYSRIEGRFDSDGDNHVDSDLSALDMPPDRLGLSWNQRWPGRWFSRLQIHHDFSRRFHQLDAPSLQSSDYTLVDLLLDRKSAVGRWSFGIANLTDRHYVTYVTQTVIQDDRVYAGLGRSYQLTWRGDF